MAAQNKLHTCKEKKLKNHLTVAVNLNKCLNQVELPILRQILSWATIYFKYHKEIIIKEIYVMKLEILIKNCNFHFHQKRCRKTLKLAV